MDSHTHRNLFKNSSSIHEFDQISETFPLLSEWVTRLIKFKKSETDETKIKLSIMMLIFKIFFKLVE